MADTTSHDTVGASTLATPLFMPSSPPPRDNEAMRSPEPEFSPISDRVATRTSQDSPQKESTTPQSSRTSSPGSTANILDARLAEYTVDFNQFPSGHAGVDEDTVPEPKLPHEDELSDVGGPEDFTANLEKYLMGDDDTFEHKEFEEEHLPESEDDDELGLPPLEEQEEEYEQELRQEQQPQVEQQDSTTHQPAVEDEAELGEYSEFGPPVDMSTPSHLLRRPSVLPKEITHLEDIEESPDDEPYAAVTPSVRKHKPTPTKYRDAENEDLRRQVAELKLVVQDRNDQLDRNHGRILEAASVDEQFKHLQTELQTKSVQLDGLHAKRSDETMMREQIQLLQKQNEKKDSLLKNASVSELGIGALQRQIDDLQRELQNRTPPKDMETERLETIAYLRQQLDLTQEQLKKRDTALDETLAKLKEITSAKERQLLEKNAERDGLKSQIDDQASEIEKLEAEVERANREYQTLEDRIASLETKNRPLEEKNSTLEADLTRAQSQVTAQENALKAMAADLPLESGGNTYTEILELIKDLGQPTTTRPGEAAPKYKNPGDHETEHLRYEVAKLQLELKEALSTRSTLESQLARSQEQASEAQSLINSIEAENARLSKRVEEIKTSLDKTQHERDQLDNDHTEALDAIERLHQDNNMQPPSPPLSPQAPRQDTRALEESHQAQLKSLQTAHTTAISTLRSSHADSYRKIRGLLSAAEKREAKLKAELLSLRSSRSAEDPGMLSLRTEIKRLESVIAVKDEAASAVDERIARSVEKREKEWERRVDLLLKERERMSRVLMWTWGEKEMGEDKENVDEHGRRNQSYRYKHAPKSVGRKA
ncbi:hypothetical protein FE257_012734 [Aspergillus nanangensis]|uniref:Spindle pole body associated protein SnaD n=1 Tax=Aspergillus nanangensis TaxID=2582783 RepID=A0AAD4GRR1_ASPNN|nr:hypothetical protein FE257_012734 [Aspergillus nanangensis]